MQINIQFNLVILLFILIISSCGNNEKSCVPKSSASKKIINPNGDSELALLMRDMYDEAVDLKQKIHVEDKVDTYLDHAKILTARATEPEKAASPEYKAFAEVYLQSVRALKECRPDQKEMHYRNMINQCKNCHQSLCPGPLVRIHKLEF